jgi:DNA helicase-2/ATP-dependent DNA helicase PcrA
VLFRKNPNVLEKYQKRFQYILVDEYQDTNIAQYEWLNLLAQKAKSVCVVGDDAQAIYSWRNANYENILNFQRDWPSTRVFKLEQNYRSTKNIVGAASELIKNNRRGYPKELWTENKTGETLKIYELSNTDAEAEFIVDQIKQTGRKFNDFVVLYRTNAQSRAIEQAFLRNDIPYRIVGGIKFYQRQEIKDVLAFLRLLQNKKDETSRQRLERLRMSDLVKKLPSRPVNKRAAIEALLKDFENYLENAKNLTELAKYVIEKANFADMLRNETAQGEEKWQNVQELLSAAAQYEQYTASRALEMFLENTSLMQDTDNVEYSSELVHLMTLHMAKGLEFPFVFIAGCEEGLLPHANSIESPAELEEERRLMYVGITRAKEMAYLLFSRHRVIFGEIRGSIPSSFLAEIPQEYVRFESFAQDYLEDEIIQLD